jgi:hypothetical protein
MDMVDSYGASDPGWGNSSYSMLSWDTSPVAEGNDAWWPNSGQLIARTGSRIQLHAIIGSASQSLTPAQALATSPYDPVNGYDALAQSPNSQAYAIYPRGDNPLVIEGSQSVAPPMGNGYTMLLHGTKMNYISVDLSVLQVDFANTYYQQHLQLIYNPDPTQFPSNPSAPHAGGKPVAPPDTNFFWYQCIGNQVSPWTKGMIQQSPTTTATKFNMKDGGAFIVDWPYYSITMTCGNLFRATHSTQY